MGIQGIVSIAIKQLARGSGLQIALLTSLVITLLTLVVGEAPPRILLLSLPVFSVLSAIFTDVHNIRSSFYALILVGATIRHVIAYSATIALMYVVIYVVPLAVIRFFTLPEYCLLAVTLFTAVVTLLITYYLYAKSVFTLVTI
ncbi:MAG: hypothetical protein J7L12_01465 [Desulfurococcales archaeon]|nr:hypothetical protein [Desulfurococcales archaeon]MCD6428267.1 hypothetical protein [Desulfurococcales archaeon]